MIDFSEPVYTYGEGLVVPKADAKAYTSQEDLKGTVVGAQVGTAFVDALKKTGLFSEVKVYDTIPDILRDVNARHSAEKALRELNATLEKNVAVFHGECRGGRTGRAPLFRRGRARHDLR